MWIQNLIKKTNSINVPPVGFAQISSNTCCPKHLFKTTKKTCLEIYKLCLTMSQWLAATASPDWSEVRKVRQPFRAVKGSGSQPHIINPICFPSLLRNTYHKGNQSCFSFSFWLVWMWIMSWSLSEWYAVLRNTYFYLCNIENAQPWFSLSCSPGERWREVSWCFSFFPLL